LDLPDHYRILQVDPSAEQEVIEAAYRRLARKYHPDVYKGNDATERMKRLNMAFAVLGNANSRREFDYLRERQTSEATSWETRQTYSETPTYPQPETNLSNVN